MATAQIRIDQPAQPTQVVAVAGRARDDLALGAAVPLRNVNDTGMRSSRWQILEQSDMASPDTLSDPTRPAPMFTPSAEGGYLTRLIGSNTRDGEKVRIIAAVCTSGRVRIPAAGERAEANWLDVTGYPNPRGWQPEVVELFELAVGDRVARSVLGRATDSAGPPAAAPSGGDGRFLVQRSRALTFDTLQPGGAAGPGRDGGRDGGVRAGGPDVRQHILGYTSGAGGVRGLTGTCGRCDGGF